MSPSTATTGRDIVTTGLFAWSMRDVGGHQRVLEHGLQRVGDIGGRVRRIGIADALGIGWRRAVVETLLNTRTRRTEDVVVGVIVFVIGKGRVHRIDRL